MPETFAGHIERILGRKVAEMGATAQYADFTSDDIEDLRRIRAEFGSYLPCIAYVRYRLAGQASLPSAVSFVEYVVNGKQSIEEWSAGR